VDAGLRLVSPGFTRRTVLAGTAAAIGAAFAAPAAAFAEPAYRAAADYSASFRGISMLVMRGGRIVFEDYPNGGAPDRPHELASGAKSFCGVMAAAAVQDRLLRLDELAADTLPEWREHPLKRRITIRHILSLTSGLATRRARGDLLTYEESVAVEAVAEPGTVFAYGGDPFQLFGEILTRKLGRKEDPVAYLKRRVLDPAGIAFASWRRGRDGMPHLGSGARLTARDWARFGEFVRLGGKVEGRPIVNPATLEACFQGSAANPAYGLSWWLNRPMPEARRAAIPQLRLATDVRPDVPEIPADLVLAAGAGKQRLYVSRKEELVVVRQATGILEGMRGRGGNGFSDAEFWRLLRRG
jgi:CubicO group peptidase (beta-lactamase class C family)